MPTMIARIGWSDDELRAERQRGLRALVASAIARSPWHRDRLGHLDQATLIEDDLTRVPPMTKDDLLAHFDEIVTDPRLDRARIEAHLRVLRDDAYLLDAFHAFASGGSSGRRGIYLYGWDAWTTCAAGILRWRASWQRTTGVERLVMVSVSAGHATHMTAAMTTTFSTPRLAVHRFPVTTPLPDIVDGINRLRPDVLHGYPSALRLLALQAQDGRLRIAPRRVAVGSEPLLPETRELLATTWGVAVENVYATSEVGGMAGTCAAGSGLHLNDDLLVVEPVDARGRPTPPGELSAKVYVTSLYNHDLPLVRYELDDQIRVLPQPCACGSAMRAIEDVHGRADDTFSYPGGVVAHPLVFSTVLGRVARVAEYQVHQTASGADVDVLPAGEPPDLASLRRDLERSLAGIGVDQPLVTVRSVASIPRLSTGKIRRFVATPPTRPWPPSTV
jgi:phenylacetate-CoA ligase